MFSGRTETFLISEFDRRWILMNVLDDHSDMVQDHYGYVVMIML